MNNTLLRVPSSPWALLIDGSALFFGQRSVSPDRNMNYVALKEQLEKENRSGVAPKTAFFFTAADEGNPNQVKFNDMIRNSIGWHVHQVAPHEASIVNPLLDEQAPRIIRFDSMIAYALGRLTAGKAVPADLDASPVARVFIVSDSWALAGPVRDCVSRGTGVTMVFFGSLIDNRWHKVFRDAEKSGGRLDFFDLDAVVQRLFDRVRPSKKGAEDLLPGLP